MKLIKWTDVGPIKENTLEVDESGGLYVLEGPIGSGKSHLLAALDDTLNPEHKSTMPVRDGAPRAEVDVFGQATLRRSKQSRRLGTLEIETLAGKFSIADLVDPQIDRLESADASRIKALIQLKGGVKAEPSLFYPLIGGQEQFNEYVPSDALATTDLVVMSAKVKAAFEKASRDLDALSKKKYAEAEAARLSAVGVDTSVKHDAGILAAEYEAATREDSRLQQAKKAYDEALVNKATAEETLSEHTKGFAHLPVDQANDKLAKAETEVKEVSDLINDLREQLAQATNKFVTARANRDIAEKTVHASESHYSTLANLQGLVGIQLPEPVIELDILAAQQNVKTAQEALERGVLVRKAITDAKTAAERKIDATKLEKQAIAWRDAAQATDTVLASVVKSLGLPLSVSGGRLIITNSDRNETGEELFADLSKGERCAIVIDIAIEAVKQPGRNGMFVVPQEFLEGLDEDHILAIARRLEGSGVVAVSAKAVNGEGITAKQIDPFPLGG